jgi:chromosome partitioning protein
MKVISVANQKGGVGKTTVSFHLGHGLAHGDRAVLLIDLDPQAHLSATFNKQDSCHALEIFSDRPSIVSEVVFIDNENTGISLTSSNIHLARVESQVSLASYTKLKKALSKETRRFDYVIVDCPPSLGVLTVNSLIASDYVLVPCLPFYFSLLGLRDLIEVVESVKEEGLNPKLNILGILINQVDRTLVTRESSDVLKEKFAKLVFNTKIPRSVRVEEALQSKQPIWEYEPTNPAAIAFKEFVREFLQKVEGETHNAQKEIFTK